MRVSKNIERFGKRFYLYGAKSMFLGSVATVNGVRCFITHIKKPSRHFYIKGQGYPINYELLKVLERAGVGCIIIPEDGKTGFRCYLANVRDYLDGALIKEPLTEPQKVIPLRQLKMINLSKTHIEELLEGK